MAIESDIQNPNGRLVVFFHKKDKKNNFKSEQEGRPIFESVIYIKKMVPGDSLSIIDRPMYESDKNEFPLQWAHFQNRQSDDQMVSGTPLIEWPILTTAQAEELRGLKFYTVENIANASDSQLQRIGMLAGMSPHTFRDKAKLFINKAKDIAEESKREEELANLREENAKIKAETDAKLAQMQDQMAAILAAVGEKKPKARKAKVVEEA